MGLVTAIPAVVAYNHFANKLRQIESEMNNFAADFLNIIKRGGKLRPGEVDFAEMLQLEKIDPELVPPHVSCRCLVWP